MLFGCRILFLFILAVASAPLDLLWAKKSSQTSQFESVPGEYVVRFKDAKSLSQIQGARRLGNTSFALVTRPPIEIQAYSIRNLASYPGVLYVEPNYIYRKFRTPNDPALNLEWGLSNVGQPDSENVLGNPGMDVGAPLAWDHATSTSIVVGIIDTGIDYRHPDLKDNIHLNEAEVNGFEGLDDDGNGYVDDVWGMDFSNASKPKANGLDDHDHGTHCAGIIGASGDNGIGISGVNWNIKMIPIKFLSRDGGGSLAGAIMAIDYGVQMGAKILSNSWGGGPESRALFEAIQRSHEAGVLFIAAAGNDGRNNDAAPVYPASYNLPNIIGVAAVHNRGGLAGFSNYGKRSVHLAAPGENIYSTTKNNRYESFSGTSMAAPFVSGVAALAWGRHSHYSHLEMKERLLKTVKKVSGLRNKTISGGLVSAANAVLDFEEPLDLQDPIHWPQHAVRIATPHPYRSNFTWEQIVEIAGAKQLALYFERFQTEAQFDTLKVYDRSGRLIQTLSGMHDGDFSDPVPGDYARLVFTSDDSVEGYGFDISAIAVQTAD